MSDQWFVDILWKTSLVSAGLLLLLQGSSGYSPAQRARLLLAGMALLALLPLLSFLLPPLQLNLLPEARDIPPDLSSALAQAPAAAVAGAPQSAAPPPPLVTQAQLLILLWVGGAALILARLGCGIVMLHRWTRNASDVSSRHWTEALHRSGAASVRLLATREVEAPLSWGLARPTILMPSDLVNEARDADAVIAHEVAHIRRGDWAALLFARVVLALYWFNPLVWLLERALLHEAEQAADAEALKIVQPVLYAETLLRVASGRHVPVAANSIAAGALRKRLLRVLEGRQSRAAARWSLTAAYLALGLSGPVAAVELLPVAAPMPRASSGLPRVGAPLLTLMPLVAHAPASASDDQAKTLAYAEAAASAAGARHRMARDPTQYPPGYLSPAHDRDHWVNDRAQWAQDRAQWAQERARWAAGREQWAQGREQWAKEQARNAEKFARERAQWTQEHTQLAIAQASEAAARAAEVAGRVQQTVAMSMQHMAVSMMNGADGMERGADGMLRGAQSMREEAVKLRDPAYRQRKIARQAAEGHPVTDQELIDSIPQLEKGADDMVKGAADMRRGAEQMRQSARERE